MEIKYKLTVTRGEGKGDMGRHKSGNMYKGLMGMNNGLGIDGGGWGWVGESNGEKVGQL